MSLGINDELPMAVYDHRFILLRGEAHVPRPEAMWCVAWVMSTGCHVPGWPGFLVEDPGRLGAEEFRTEEVDDWVNAISVATIHLLRCDDSEGLLIRAAFPNGCWE